MEGYVKGRKLGEGQFAKVFEATHKETGDTVAIKVVHIADTTEGVHVTALREIKLLRELNHPHIIRLRDVFTLKKNIALVLEFMDSHLEAVIQDRSLVLAPADIKSYMQQLLRALHVCHSNYIVHRDIKPNNCLIAPDGTLKLADFGLARNLGSPERDPGRPYTHQVFARWYRAPELLFGCTSYGFAVDIWAAGCILAELLLRRPWFPGNTDIDQLGRIFQALGTPTEADWPGVNQLPCYLEFTPTPAPPLRSQFSMAMDDVLSLLTSMMSLDPRKRPTAEEALNHRWFTADPLPTPVAKLPRPQTRAATAGLGETGARAVDVGGLLGVAGTGVEAVTEGAEVHRPHKKPRASSSSAATPPGESYGAASPALASDAAGKFSPRPGQAVHG